MMAVVVVRSREKKSSPQRLSEAAAELRAYLDVYLRGPTTRKGEPALESWKRITLRVEPLLRHYLDSYAPKKDSETRQFEHKLASAAWQIVGRQLTSAQLMRAIEGVRGIRRDHSARDSWPANATDVSMRIRLVLGSKRMDGFARANRVFEILAEGHRKPDTRRGVRPERRALLESALATAKLSALRHRT